jgi:hypothetical protein
LGILLGNGSYNVFYGNLVANSGGLGHDGYGLALGGTETKVENNLFFYNAFVNNSKNFGGNWQVIGSNSFDNGSVGNYWDDYLTQYPNAAEVGNSGIGNTPYLVYANNMDNYPLLNKLNVSDAIPALPSPWSSLLSATSPSDTSPSASQSPNPTTEPSITTQPTQSDNPNAVYQTKTQPQGLPEETIYGVAVTIIAVTILAVVLSLRWKKLKNAKFN